MLGTLDQEQIDRVLQSEVVGRIGCHARGRTYVVPITYAYDGQSVYGHSIDGMKLAYMRANPDICFEVEHVDNLANWKSVIAWGTFEELQGTAAEEGMRLLVNRVMPLLTSETMHAPTLNEDAVPRTVQQGGHRVERHPGAHAGEAAAKAVVFRIRLSERTGRYERCWANAQRGGGMSMRFPRVQGANLERRDYTLPDDFEGEVNLALIAFRREQQFDVDTWVPAARALMARYPALRYYELPTISRRLPFARWWLDDAMRAGIPDRAVREATITLYLDKLAFRRLLDLPSEETIHVMLVTRDGQILWRAEGAWTAEKGLALEQLLAQVSWQVQTHTAR